MEQYKYKVIPEEATYDNWWNGDVTLVHATRYCNKGDEPLLVDWADFSESDADKIKDMQWEIFADAVNTRLKAVCSQFIKRYEFSEMKLEYFTDERQDCWNVMFAPIPNVKIVIFKHLGICLENQDLSDIQFYVNRTIKSGIDDGLGFIHSPNCKYQDKSISDSRIYARFVWEYFKWLESLIVKKEKTDNALQKAETEIASLKKEPITEPIVKLKEKDLENSDKIDFNMWNENAKSLFEYLIEHYNKPKGKQKYKNIFHFLKNNDKANERKEIGFYYSVDEYKLLIKKLNNCEWVKTNKPANFESQLKILNSHYTEWRNQFKGIENPQNTL